MSDDILLKIDYAIMLAFVCFVLTVALMVMVLVDPASGATTGLVVPIPDTPTHSVSVSPWDLYTV